MPPSLDSFSLSAIHTTPVPPCPPPPLSLAVCVVASLPLSTFPIFPHKITRSVQCTHTHTQTEAERWQAGRLSGTNITKNGEEGVYGTAASSRHFFRLRKPFQNNTSARTVQFFILFTKRSDKLPESWIYIWSYTSCSFWLQSLWSGVEMGAKN